MNPTIKEAANDQLRRLEIEVQAHRMNIIRLENDIQSRNAEIAWRNQRVAVLSNEIVRLQAAVKPKGKGKRNAKSASKSRRVRV